MKKTIFILLMLLATIGTASAQMIGATNNQSMPHQTGSSGSPKGSILRFSAGYPILGSIAYNYQFNPYFSFGGGAGVAFLGETRVEHDQWGGRSEEYMYDVGPVGASTFLELEVDIPLSKMTDWTCFINAKFAYNLSTYEDLSSYFSHPFTGILTVGAKYLDIRFGVGMSTVWWFGGFFSYDIHL